jgi:hypothetical protein
MEFQVERGESAAMDGWAATELRQGCYGDSGFHSRGYIVRSWRFSFVVASQTRFED